MAKPGPKPKHGTAMSGAERQASSRMRKKSLGGVGPPPALARFQASQEGVYAPPPLLGFPPYALRPSWFWTESDRARAQSDFRVSKHRAKTLEDFGSATHAFWLSELAKKIS